MDLSQSTLRILLLLLPGVVAALAIERLTVHPKWEQFRFALYAFLLGCVSYLGLFVWYAILGLFYKCGEGPSMNAWRAFFDSETLIPPQEVLYACIVGLLFGLLMTRSVYSKWWHRLAKFLRISDKYGDENLFTYFLRAKDTDWVLVRDQENGLTFEGLVHSLSESGGLREVLLTQVKVYDLISGDFMYEIPAVYKSFGGNHLQIERAHFEEGE